MKSRAKDRSSLSVHLTSVSRSIRRQTTFHIKVLRNVTVGSRAYTRHAIKAIDYYLYVWKAEGIERSASSRGRAGDASWELSIFDPSSLLRFEIVSTISIFSNHKYYLNNWQYQIPYVLILHRRRSSATDLALRLSVNIDSLSQSQC